MGRAQGREALHGRAAHHRRAPARYGRDAYGGDKGGRGEGVGGAPTNEHEVWQTWNQAIGGTLRRLPTIARGLSVNFDGSPRPRAFIRIDDLLDEIVIVIYALMPRIQYVIECF